MFYFVESSSSSHKRARVDPLPASNLDADDPIDNVSKLLLFNWIYTYFVEKKWIGWAKSP